MIAAIISTDAVLRARLEAALEGAEGIDSVLIIPEYPHASDIRSLENKNEKYIAFIDFHENVERAILLASSITRNCPSIGTIGINVSSTQAALIAVVRAGIGEVLPQPFSNRDVETAVRNVTHKLEGASGSTVGDGVVYAFLPAKPGSGASSLATYSALACGRLTDRRPLLLDFDIRLGITSFVLKLDSSHSIADALKNATHMDQSLWTQLVSERDNLDVLGSAPIEFGGQLPLESFDSLLKWARRQYPLIVVDLPGNMEDYEIATLRQAGTIFLVCGPDLVSLHTARQTIQRLFGLNLLDRVSVVLNRLDKRSGLSMRDIEGILGMPILVTMPTDERSIREAVRDGTGVSSKSALGKQIEALARKMPGNVQDAAPPRPKNRFLSFFSVEGKKLDGWRQ